MHDMQPHGPWWLGMFVVRCQAHRNHPGDLDIRMPDRSVPQSISGRAVDGLIVGADVPTGRGTHKHAPA
ncbi:hypothetical protein FRACA_3290006 [Frankia canadensis]|uniref:Uncharacterized protein n=1 Tax=Frankia canadensis TaxID=1836972 RepID=A0A2I2KUQ4_9ACTN|nr:hypothetical protein FRACA_3290006 [Frankia canadensis]SOU56687.1 hypothetical protein FRACA_3290006 [Frankia canadensis]